ncbi:MAG: hypothetical protein KAV87_41130 [Desulfobacteraceae bacterium]|nr:hypothetical protein [Desulfobacteraceae bacterium]
MPSLFRSFAKKAFNTAKSFIKETADRFKSKPMERTVSGPKRRSESKQAEQIDAGMRKIQAFIMRGIILNPVPKRHKDTKPHLKRCTNHQPETRRPRKYLFRTGDAGYLRGKPLPWDRSRHFSRTRSA